MARSPLHFPFGCVSLETAGTSAKAAAENKMRKQMVETPRKLKKTPTIFKRKKIKTQHKGKKRKLGRAGFEPATPWYLLGATKIKQGNSCPIFSYTRAKQAIKRPACACHVLSQAELPPRKCKELVSQEF